MKNPVNENPDGNIGSMSAFQSKIGMELSAYPITPNVSVNNSKKTFKIDINPRYVLFPTSIPLVRMNKSLLLNLETLE